MISVAAASASSGTCDTTEVVEDQIGMASALFQAGSLHQRLQTVAEESKDGAAELSLFQFAGVNGSRAELSESGYADVAGLCCHREMTEFVTRVVRDMGLTLCGHGGPEGIAHYYYGCGQTQSLSSLKSEIINALGKDCPWVASGSCPVRQPHCVDLPGTESRRRCVVPTSTVVPTMGTQTTKRRLIETTSSLFYTTVATTTITTTTTTRTSTTTPICDVRFTLFPALRASMLVENNLGGVGPELMSKPHMLFKEFGQFQGKSFDLVIQNITEYTGTGGGTHGNFVYIQVQGGFSVDLAFSFRQTHTHALLTLPEFHLGLFDVDQSLKGRMAERIFISGHHGIVVHPSAEVNITKQVGGDVIVNSKLGGDGCDNPQDPLDLKVVTCNQNGVDKDVDQRKRSALIVYRKVATFTLTLETTCAGTCQSGRMFYFASGAALQDQCA